ncbi:uncharacterized protein VTP21DRAFT_6294 [Calcarisporiella thermophila]|uniref:uncharacterized protein n=1 Tax=Calcarisporiella thermophila TaxID=911321 RepID=UPI0037435BF3
MKTDFTWWVFCREFLILDCKGGNSTAKYDRFDTGDSGTLRQFKNFLIYSLLTWQDGTQTGRFDCLITDVKSVIGFTMSRKMQIWLQDKTNIGKSALANTHDVEYFCAVKPDIGMFSSFGLHSAAFQDTSTR